ncbi:MAG: glycosyltransferase family 4 protein [Roseivirga sp.]
MKKVLNIGLNYFIQGGSDRYMVSLGKLLSENGYEVIPFAAQNQNSIETEYARYFPQGRKRDSINPRELIKSFYNLDSAKKLEQLIKDTSPDLAHIHIYYGKLSASILPVLKKYNIPTVQTLHEYKTICPTYTLYRNGHICTDCKGKHFYKAALNRCNKGSLIQSLGISLEAYISRTIGSQRLIDKFITVSDFQREKILEFDTISAQKISTVHNFLDASDFEPGFQPGTYFLYFGRLDKTKGILTLVKALERLPHIKLLIAGTGDYENELRSYVTSHDMDNVEFLGFKSGNDLHDLIRGAIACTIPSEWYETFGLTTIESFALGRPVIGARIGGITEVISEGRDGFLFEPGNVDELTEKIDLLNGMKETTAIEMGKKGRSKVEEQFSRQVHLQKITHIYNQL